MLKAALLVVLATTFAQVLPSCGGGGGTTDVVGWVEMKKIEPSSHGFIITINSVDYDVPGYFWQQVAVGDLVKWDGTTWTIVRKRAAFSRPRLALLSSERVQAIDLM